MSARNDGGTAFPGSYTWDNDGDRNARAPDGRLVAPGARVSVSQPGMTLRDYFAAAAVGAVLLLPNRDSTLDEDATLAYRLADAMLKERAK